MDITHFIKILEEFKKLKIVIFYSEQNSLFNFLSKEYIFLNKESIEFHTLIQLIIF